MEIETEIFADQHYPEVNEWYLNHFGKSLPKSKLPAYGLVSIIDGKLCAACWVVRTEIDFCLTDLWVVNPKISREQRNVAISALFPATDRLVKRLGYSNIKADIAIPKLRKRAEEHGFRPLREAGLYIKEISK